MKSINLIIQSRTSSTRLPGKVLMKLGDITLLELVIQRVKKATKIDKIIIATSLDKSDDEIESIVRADNQIDLYRGSLSDVLDRYYQASKNFPSDAIVRITADCPLIDPILIDRMISDFEKNDLDYYSNTLKPQYPDGQDIEIFSFSALEKAWANATEISEREHVTPFIYNNSNYNKSTLFKAENFQNSLGDFSHVRMTVDYLQDYKLICSLVAYGGFDLTWKAYVDLLKEKELDKLNMGIKRNEGFQKFE